MASKRFKSAEFVESSGESSSSASTSAHSVYCEVMPKNDGPDYQRRGLSPYWPIDGKAYTTSAQWHLECRKKQQQNIPS
ncbi:hypothetical protein TYRP_023634 [Tyrophagus putrescentiae]|nr:hypothetical protein TYRP_023634 [Tyrophagus putrescentiae]